MASIDERVVAMAFENAKFEAGVAKTMATLQKLNQAIANTGKVNALGDIEKAAAKVTLQTPLSALDKLKQRLFGASTGASEGFNGIEVAGRKITLQGPLTALDRLRTRLFGASTGAAEGMSGIETAGNRVTLAGPLRALDGLRNRLSRMGTGSAEGFAQIEAAGNRVTLGGPIRAAGKVQQAVSHVGAGAAESFRQIENAGNHVTFGGVQRAAQASTRGFSAMQTVAAGAIGGVAAVAALKGKDIVKSLSLGPVIQGFQEYGTNLKSIQTILANTQFQGTNLKQVNGSLAELNKYSDQTIYNFSEMAKNIGTFTAAGVDLKTATGSIKGIANLAALSGSNSEQASTAMYQLSQAISSGRVGLQDWNSVVNAGMGGAVFQRSLAQTAVAMGTVEKGAVKIDKATGKATINGKSFRESITAKPGQKSWLTDKVLTTSLKSFTGDMTMAQLKAKGFSEEQAKSIMKLAKTAKKAATESKTLGDVMNVVKEAIGSGWAITFQTIFGNFKEAKKLFTDLATYLQKIIGHSAETRNKILGDWKKLGGRTALIEGIKNAFHALLSILKPIKDAFRDVFPQQTGKNLYNLTLRFREFTKSLAIGPETAKNLQRTFRGFFSLLHIGWTVVKTLTRTILNLFGVFTGHGNGLLSMTASFGDFITALDKGISKGKGFSGVFKGLGNTLRLPIELIKGLGSAIAGLFGANVDEDAGKKLGAKFSDFKKALGPLGKAIQFVQDMFHKLMGALQKVKTFLTPFFNAVVHIFSTIGHAIIDGVKKIDYDKVMAAIRTAFLGGIAVGLKKLAQGIGIKISGGLGVGLNKQSLKTFKEVSNVLTTSLTAIQRNINAHTMLLIAGSILALAGATLIFSQISPKKLASAMTAIAIGMGELVAGLHLLTVGMGAKGVAMVPLLALAMVLLAGSLLIMGAAVKKFSKMSWEEIARGLAGVAGSLIAVGLASKLMGPSLLGIGPGLVAVAGALTIMAVAMKIMGSIGWEDLAKGILGVGLGLTALSIGVSGMGPEMLLIGPGLALAALGLILLSGALSSFGAISLYDLAKGLLGISLALDVLVIGMSAIPPGMAARAAGVGVLAIALLGLSAAVGVMGNMKIWTLAKGLLAISLALDVFAIGLKAMQGTIGGTLALLGAAVALGILTPVLVTLGSLKWGTIIKGLAAIAGIMLVVGGIGLVASEGILALGIGLGVLAAAAVLGATAVYLFSAAISNLGANGTKGFAVLVTAITAFIALLPKMATDFMKAMVDILASLAQLAPKVATSIVSIVQTFVAALIQLQPQALAFIGMLMTSLITLIYKYSVPLVAAGFHLLLALLNGLANNIGPVVSAGARIVAGFLGGLARNAGAIVANGARLVVNYIRGLASRMPAILSAGASLIRAFLTGVARATPGVISKAATLVRTFLNQLAKEIPGVIRSGVNVLVAVLKGIAQAIPRVAHYAVNVIIAFIRTIGREGPRVADAGAKMVIDFLNGLARAIRNNAPEMRRAGWNVAKAIAGGLVGGLTDSWGYVLRKVTGLVHLIPKKVRDILHIHSPSRVMIGLGNYISEGLAAGINQGQPKVMYAMTGMATGVIDQTQEAINGIPAALNNMGHLSPVITPVLNLSQVEKEAQRLNALTRVNEIDPAKSYYNASAISALEAARQLAKADESHAAPQKVVNLEQNNYSPESLSAIEIYRQTRNQLSQVQSALAER